MQQSLNRTLQQLSLNFLEHPKKSHVQSAVGIDIRLIYSYVPGFNLPTLVAGRPLKAKNLVGIFFPSHSSVTC